MLGKPRQLLILMACAASILFAPAAATASELVAIIASKELSGMESGDTTLRAIYLKKIFLDQAGESLIPVNLPADNPLRLAFTRSVVHMGESQLHNYWNRRYFQGVSPPYVLASQKAVMRFVAATPGAIGYVRSCFVDDSVKTLRLLSIPESKQAPLESCPGTPGT